MGIGQGRGEVAPGGEALDRARARHRPGFAWSVVAVAAALASLPVQRQASGSWQFDLTPMWRTWVFVLLWQWGLLVAGARLAVAGAPRRVVRLVLGLSVLGSCTAFQLTSASDARPDAFVLTSGSSGLPTVATVVLLLAPSVVAALVLIDQPSTAVGPIFRHVVRGACAVTAVGGVAAAVVWWGTSPSELLERGALHWLAPFFALGGALALLLGWRGWTGEPDKVPIGWQVGVSLAYVVASAAAVGSQIAPSQRVDLLTGIGHAGLPLAALVVVVRDFWVTGKTKHLRQIVRNHDSPAELQVVLRRAFGDPELLLTFRVGDGGKFVDVSGREVPTAEFDRRRAQAVPATGAPIAALLWSTDVDATPASTKSLMGVATLAIEKAHLQATVLTQMNDLTESRRRLVDATDQARRAVERDLHDGAQQRLAALTLRLRMAAKHAASDEAIELATRTADELMDAVTDLQDLARGIHPAVLSDSGLRAAVESLVDRTPFPVTLDVLAERLTSDIELTAYFVIAEALANSAKHSGASEGEVQAHRWGPVLTVTVSDSGRGGAAIADGSGLQGLADRVEAVGGAFRLNSPVGVGTIVSVTLPVADREPDQESLRRGAR